MRAADPLGYDEAVGPIQDTWYSLTCGAGELLGALIRIGVWIGLAAVVVAAIAKPKATFAFLLRISTWPLVFFGCAVVVMAIALLGAKLGAPWWVQMICVVAAFCAVFSAIGKLEGWRNAKRAQLPPVSSQTASFVQAALPEALQTSSNDVMPALVARDRATSKGWDQRELKTLEAMAKIGATAQEISLATGRTVAAVQAKARRLGIPIGN